MLSSVLHSPRAVQVNIAIMRAFVRLREALSRHKELAHQLAEVERKLAGHDEDIKTIFEAIRQLTAPPGAAAQGNRLSHQGGRGPLRSQKKGCTAMRHEERQEVEGLRLGLPMYSARSQQ